MSRGKLPAEFDAENESRYSDLRVLRSGAGWYVGTTYNNPDGFIEPGSRESEEYYPTEEAAQAALDGNTFTQREHP